MPPGDLARQRRQEETSTDASRYKYIRFIYSPHVPLGKGIEG